MDPSTSEYYTVLQQSYGATIRQLVPRYDDMVERVADLVVESLPAGEEPCHVLDIGAGTGALAATLLEREPRVSVTALEPHPAMAAEACETLAPFGARATVVEAHAAEYAVGEPLAAAMSNLVLHNLGPEDRRSLLGNLGEALRPRGAFVWGDMIRFDDPDLQQYFVDYRWEHALATGCAPELVRWNFRKEGEADHPLTVEEALHLSREEGFEPSLAWAHDLFAVLVLRSP